MTSSVPLRGHVIGGACQSPALAQDDPELWSEGLLNDHPPLIDTALSREVLGRALCPVVGCRHAVASIQRAETGEGSFYFAECRVAGRTSNGLDLRLVRTLLRPKSVLLADCDQHGRLEVPVDPLLRQCEKARTSKKKATFRAVAVGKPLGHDIVMRTFTPEEFEELWERSTGAPRR